jgi:hypothetical protein
MIIVRGTAILCMSLLVAQKPYAIAQQPQPAAAPGAQRQLSPEQLDSLVAPVALYPDPILSQVLVASTYPLEIVEAARWLKANSNLQGKALADAAAKQPWDASVQALVVLPEVLNRLNQEVNWTTDLGNAFLAQQDGVMEAVQRMRQKASANGALKSTPQQTVTTATENNQSYIEIQPASPEVVYVPEYNPAAVWGASAYPYPSMYYPPYSGYLAAGAISFGVGMAVGAIWGGGWNNWGWRAGWGHNDINVNRNFINQNNFNRASVGNGNRWVHNPGHRGGVPYANRDVGRQFGHNGAANRMNNRPTAAQTQQRLNQFSQRSGQGAFTGRGGGMPGQGGAARIGQGAIGQGGGHGMGGAGVANRMQPSPGQGAGSQIGNRNIGAGAANRGAFGGMNQGGNRSFSNSNRGFASRSGGFGGGGGGFRGGGGFHRGGGGGFRGGGGRGGGGRGGGRRR